MASALDGYAAAAQNVATSEPTAVLLSNCDGQPVTSAADAMEKLVAQLTRPVRWDLCSELCVSAVSRRSSSSHRRGLSGIAKRELRRVPTRAVKTPADLDGWAEL